MPEVRTAELVRPWSRADLPSASSTVGSAPALSRWMTCAGVPWPAASISAVTPLAACWSMSAPLASSVSMSAPGALEVTAAINGVSPAALRACTSAPAARAASMAGTSPVSSKVNSSGTGGVWGARSPNGGRPSRYRPIPTTMTTRTMDTRMRMSEWYPLRGVMDHASVLYPCPMPGAWRVELRDLLMIAGPLVLAQLAQNGMSFVDTIMVGRLGGGALAGMALGAIV